MVSTKPRKVGDKFRHKLTGEVAVVAAVSEVGRGFVIHFNDGGIHPPYAYRQSWTEFKRYRKAVAA